jgi:LacI family transcriptional regulator
MARPTIADLARAAGVSVSTVDRVLNGRDPVRRPTAERVLASAEAIGFYGLGAIKQRLSAEPPERTLGFLLQQGSRAWYRDLAAALTAAAAVRADARIGPRVEFMDDLSPEAVAERMLRLGAHVDAMAVVAAQHPRVTQAVESLFAQGVPTLALISELTAGCGVGYVGLDNWKVGRMAAWAISGLCKRPGRIGILVGSHRYRCQEMNEIGFRSYFREHAPEFRLLEPLSTQESATLAAELTRDLLRREPDLAGLYVSGGGITGALAALREAAPERRIVTVGYELIDPTRAGLLDGTLTLAIAHPIKRLAEEAVALMLEATAEAERKPPGAVLLPFDIYTAENL